MGITTLNVEVANPANPVNKEKGKFIIHPGAVCSAVEVEIPRHFQIKPVLKEGFHLVDETKIIRRKGDAALLGALSFEVSGLALDPPNREPKTLPPILANQDSTA